MLSMFFLACSTTGSVIVEKQPSDTASIDDTGDVVEETDTDTDETDTDETDTEELEIPNDNNNPSIYPNYWDGFRDLSWDGCTERIIETGEEVTNDYPEWLALCDCDEIYYVVTDRDEACDLDVLQQFFRGVKYNGREIEVRYWPGSPTSPTESTLLATGSINSDGESWSYEYRVNFDSGSVDIEGGVSFSE